MQKFDTPDEQMLGAFVDGQLDVANSERVISAMDSDPRIREQVYQLRRAKDLLRLGFGSATPPARQPSSAPRSWIRRYSFAIAASLATVAVGTSAWSLGYYYSPLQAGPAAATLAGAVQQQPRSVVLHISDSNPEHFAAALDYVERFIDRDAGRGAQLEVIANAGGLDLMRAGVSPYAKKVSEIITNHGNVQFIACANALRNLKEQGVTADIIADIDTGHTAVDRIVERLQAGWSYVKVESLTEL